MIINGHWPAANNYDPFTLSPNRHTQLRSGNVCTKFHNDNFMNSELIHLFVKPMVIHTPTFIQHRQAPLLFGQVRLPRKQWPS